MNCFLLQVKDEKKYLEKKILDLEETLKFQIKNGVQNCVPMLDASCECVLITNYTNNDGSGMFGHSEDLETNIVPDVSVYYAFFIFRIYNLILDIIYFNMKYKY